MQFLPNINRSVDVFMKNGEWNFLQRIYDPNNFPIWNLEAYFQNELHFPWTYFTALKPFHARATHVSVGTIFSNQHSNGINRIHPTNHFKFLKILKRFPSWNSINFQNDQNMNIMDVHLIYASKSHVPVRNSLKNFFPNECQKRDIWFGFGL